MIFHACFGRLSRNRAATTNQITQVIFVIIQTRSFLCQNLRRAEKNVVYFPAMHGSFEIVYVIYESQLVEVKTSSFFSLKHGFKVFLTFCVVLMFLQ